MKCSGEVVEGFLFPSGRTPLKKIKATELHLGL
jgi:hypothetical protein